MNVFEAVKQNVTPRQPEEEWNPRFVEALQKLPYLEYLLDELLSGDLQERAEIINKYEKEVRDIEQRIRNLSADSTKHRRGSTMQFGTEQER